MKCCLTPFLHSNEDIEFKFTVNVKATHIDMKKVFPHSVKGKKEYKKSVNLQIMIVNDLVQLLSYHIEPEKYFALIFMITKYR